MRAAVASPQPVAREINLAHAAEPRSERTMYGPSIAPGANGITLRLCTRTVGQRSRLLPAVL
jgi:hypothetical protein